PATPSPHTPSLHDALPISAKNLTDEGAELLRAALVDFEEAVREHRPDVESVDARFHLMTGRVTGNPTVIGVHSALYSLMKDFRSHLDRSSYEPTDRVVAGHRRIFDAIVARDERLAANAMRDHLDDVTDAIN